MNAFVVATVKTIVVGFFAMMLLLVVAAAVGAAALAFLRTRSAAAATFAAVSAGIGTLFVLVILGFFWFGGSRVQPTPPVARAAVLVDRPGASGDSTPPRSERLDREIPEPRQRANDSAPAVPATAESPSAEAPTAPEAKRPTAPAGSAPTKTEAESPASNGSSAKPPVGMPPDEHQDQQALGELRRRIFERVVVALREIIAEEMPAEGPHSAESAIDSAISAAIDQRPLAEKPLPPPASPPPDWLSAAGSAGSAGSGGSVVVVGPHVDVAECERHLFEAVQPVVAEFVANYLGPEWKDRVTLPEEFVRTELIRDRYVETVPASFGPMVQLHLLLSFDGKVKAQLAAQQLEIVRRQRIGAIAAVFGGFLGLLAIAYSALRHDAAHGGQGRSGTLAWAGTAAGACIALTVAAMRYLSF